MDQLSFASLDFASKKKRTKRDVFLAEMAAVVPWSALEAIIRVAAGWRDRGRDPDRRLTVHQERGGRACAHGGRDQRQRARRDGDGPPDLGRRHRGVW